MRCRSVQGNPIEIREDPARSTLPIKSGLCSLVEVARTNTSRSSGQRDTNTAWRYKGLLPTSFLSTDHSSYHGQRLHLHWFWKQLPGVFPPSQYMRWTRADVVPQGNHWCSRDSGSDGSGYHYSNTYVFSLIVINVVTDSETRPTK